MGVVVVPAHLYGNSKQITPSDTVNNLLSGDVALRYLHNNAATSVTVVVKSRNSSTDLTASIPAGQWLELPAQALRVMATGTTSGAGLTSLWGFW